MTFRPLSFLLVLLASGSFACDESSAPASTTASIALPAPVKEVLPQFGNILEAAGLEGTILLYHAEENQYFSNDFDWASKGVLPASTFKIANSMIALETGVVEDDSSMFYWDGEPRMMTSWEEDLSLLQAFRRSCVPCYQEVAREVGVDRMNDYLEAFDYGNIVVDSSNIDLFWLEGASTISPFQQVDFLHRVFTREVSISDATFQTLRLLMSREKADDYELLGKTGWSISGEDHNGWFVGLVVGEGATWYFATNVVPGEEYDMSLFAEARVKVTREALALQGVIPAP